jgi:microcystin-dependent protein
MAITGSGIPANDTIATIVSGTAITLATAASTSVTGVAITVTAGTSATVGNLGYTPENRAGDSCTGVHVHNGDIVVHTTTPWESAVSLQMSSANASNTGYMPAVGFVRPSVIGRALGLHTDGRLKTVDSNGTVGYLLDTVTKVDTNSYQAGSITLAALAQSLINIIIPSGMIRLFGGNPIPSGWLLCDGTAVSRSTYAALWNVIGTLWGAGDGANTFNLPNLQGRTPIGYVTNAGTAGAVTARGFGNSASYGTETHVMTVAELVNHNHTLHDPGHFHTYVNPVGGAASVAGSGQYSPVGSTPTTSNSTNISIDPAGSSTAFNLMQPFAVVYVIIKT